MPSPPSRDDHPSSSSFLASLPTNPLHQQRRRGGSRRFITDENISTRRRREVNSRMMMLHHNWNLMSASLLVLLLLLFHSAEVVNALQGAGCAGAGAGVSVGVGGRAAAAISPAHPLTTANAFLPTTTTRRRTTSSLSVSSSSSSQESSFRASSYESQYMKDLKFISEEVSAHLSVGKKKPMSVNWDKVHQLTNELTTLHMSNGDGNGNGNSDDSEYYQPTIHTSNVIHQTLKQVTSQSFHPHTLSYTTPDHAWQGIKVGLQLMEWQASAATSASTNGVNHHHDHHHPLLPPHNAVPRSVCLQGMKALNQLTRRKRRRRGGGNATANANGISSLQKNTQHNKGHPMIRVVQHQHDADKQRKHQAIASYRILQRLCTGIGLQSTASASASASVSASASPLDKSDVKVELTLDERDFNMVLNAFVNVRDMDMAHRVVALQERTKHAPPLSPVTYSILCKGYGQLKDWEGVRTVHDMAKHHEVIPTDDIVLYNSLMDAYINCGDVDRAHAIFRSIAESGSSSNKDEDNRVAKNKTKTKTKTKRRTSLELQDFDWDDDDEVEHAVQPVPNLRTYNTMLKGFVQSEDVNRALLLSKQMKKVGLWDAVTTNTLVSVAVASRKFDLAESILLEHHHGGSNSGDDSHSSQQKQQQKAKKHPHVEAYTGLIDGYAKHGNLHKAMATFKLMRQRDVSPNEYTYTSVIYALTKVNQIAKAKKLLDFMEHTDSLPPSTATYNAFFTGMVEHYNAKKQSNNAKEEDDRYDIEQQHEECNDAYDQAMTLFQQNMMKKGIRPNAITIAALIDMAGVCHPPKLNEAKSLFHTMEENGYLPSSSLRVSTALIGVCGIARDVDCAMKVYESIEAPDVIAFNALLNALCRNGKIKMAIEVLKDNAMKRKRYQDENADAGVGGASSITTSGNDRNANQSDNHFIETDVATYSILISSLLKIGTAGGSRAAFKLYKEMKREWNIFPDTGLVDIILTAMVSGGNSLGLSDNDFIFTSTVLRDAKKLEWPKGQLRRRERTVRAIFMGRTSEAWKEQQQEEEEVVDPLFKKKNWNTIDSGFRLWGGGIGIGNARERSQGSTSASERGRQGGKRTTPDDFLESKNWGAFDSSFKII